MNLDDLRITIWNGAFERQGWVGDPIELSVTERFNEVSTGRLTIRSDHHRGGALLAKGSRLTVDYAGRQMLSGRVFTRGGFGPYGELTFEVRGDFSLFENVGGWPVPGNALSNQNVAYDVRSGPAETVLKGFLSANVARLGLPVTVAPDQGRGATIKEQLRMRPLADRLFPAVTDAGLGVSVTQGPTGLVVDVYEPQVYPRTLSVLGGQIKRWEWSESWPVATRVVAGDQGQAEARNFTQSIDSALEAEWFDVVEAFTDARDTDDAATVAQRRADVLAEGAPKRGFKVEFSESKGFRYGHGLTVGDSLTMEVAPGIPITDVLKEAVLTLGNDGLVVEPVVGERTDDPSIGLAKVLASLRKQYRHLGSAW